MSWLPDLAAGHTGLAQVFGLRPDLYDAFRAFYAVFWTRPLLDPVVLELCRLRVAQLVGCATEVHVRYRVARDAGLTETQIAALARWPDEPTFTDAQRAALAYAEQFVLDPHGVTDAQHRELLEHFSAAQLVELTAGLALFLGFSKIAVALGPPPDMPTMVVPTPDWSPDPAA